MGATLLRNLSAPGYPPCAASRFVFHEGETLSGAKRAGSTLFSPFVSFSLPYNTRGLILPFEAEYNPLLPFHTFSYEMTIQGHILGFSYLKAAGE